jgi:hypothetical protein
MPQVTVYVREEDLDSWKAISKKSEFIHNAINSNPKIILKPEIKVDKVAEIFNIPGVVRGAEFVPKPPDPVFGYPCCKAKKPCKHWQWNDLDGAWINSITGEARET